MPMKRLTTYRTDKPSLKEAISWVLKLKLTDKNWWLVSIDSLWQQSVVRYFFAAATATFVDVFVFWFIYNIILHQQNHDILGLINLKAPTISLVCGFGMGLITNFLITKFFVFNESLTRTRWQFLKFILVSLVVFVANYYLLWFLTSHLQWYATIARAVSAVTIGLFSFVAHKFFSFKI